MEKVRSFSLWKTCATVAALAAVLVALTLWLWPANVAAAAEAAQSTSSTSSTSSSGRSGAQGGADQPVSTTIFGLTNAEVSLDGKDVVVHGEAVGDITNADGGNKWLTLQDGESSISVYLSAADAQKISYLGRYDQVGDTLRIEGEFQVDCAHHDGLSDLHASSVRVVSVGYETPSFLNMREVQIGGLLLIVGLCLLFIHWRLRERTR